MWQIEESLVTPQVRPGDPKLPAQGILAVNPADAAALMHYAKSTGLGRFFLFNSNLYCSEDLFVAGPAVGAPMAALCLEKLIALGAQQIILYGWCGSLCRQVQARDLLIPGLAFSEEGTSPHYRPDRSTRIQPSAALRTRLCSVLSQAGLPYHEGSLWTTDAPYRETRTKIEYYASQAVLGVDMEYAALCSVAALREVALAAALLVSDEVWRAPWQPQYAFKDFKRQSAKLLHLLCEAVRHRHFNF
jgi:uridine phosphorylase